MQYAKSLKLGILALLLVALTIFPGCGGTVPPVNHSPVIFNLIASPSSIEVNQDTAITCIATDQDGDTLTYIWTKTGGTITGTGSAITWTAPATTGNYTITCTVSDGKLIDIQVISITVTEPEAENHSPVIISTAINSAIAGETYTYNVNASDPDEGDILTYSLIAAPAGMTISSSSGLINWTPTAAGSFGVTVNVSDGELTDSQSFAVTVLAAPGDEATLEEEYNNITQVGSSAAEEFLNFEDTYGEEQALQKTVDYLNQQEGIENVSLDEESGNISFEFENGHLGTIITYDVNKSSKLDAGKGEFPFPIERIKHLSKGTPTKEKALLLNPFPSIFVGNSAQYIKGKLEAIGYQCDYYEGEEVTVELMKNMEDYGVIYIDTHGGVVNTNYGKEVDFAIGQKGSKQLYEQYDSDLMLHRLGHVWIPSLSLSHYFFILPHFISEYAETSYPKSLIYIDACNSYKNPTMAEAFKDEGAYVYCGYSSLILAFNYSERKVFDNMIDETMTIQEAVDEVGASNLHFHPEDREDFCLVEEDEDEIKFWDGSFANREWTITTGTNGPQADSNLVYCSESLDNVWIDDQNPGRLHLKITYDNANQRWNCAQIGSVETLGGYGKYTFYIDNVIMKTANGEEYNATELDKNVVIGLYTYDNDCSHPSKNEIDLEFSEWGNSGFEEGWFIVWKDGSPSQLLRDRCNFPIQLVGKSSVHSFDWTENSIDFESASGTYKKTAHYPSSTFENLGGNGYIPQHQNEKVLMNIWLDGGEPYSNDMKSAEIIISSFEFDEDEQTENHPPTISDLSADSPSVNVDQTTTITCIASDPDGDPLTYKWTVNAGSFEGDTSGPSVTWKAPSTADIYIVVGCEVSDGEGGEDSESRNIIVTEPDDNDEDKIENVIHKLFQAINDRDWDEAKNCCVYGSDFYVEIDEYEQCYNLYGALECDILDEYIVNDINQIIINGEYAEAYVYMTATAIVDGEVVELHGEGWYFSQKITNDWKIYATTGSEEDDTYTITASAGSHGSISPSGSVTVNEGSDKSFTITPDTGYQIDNVLVDGSSVGAVSSYTFSNVYQNHSIYATFIIEDSGTYALRDIGPAGGYIFYDKGYYSNGWRYLEAAPVSTEPYYDWCWCSDGTFIRGTKTGIGSGQSNTTTIVAWLNSHSETHCVAQRCDALVYSGYSDWFMPSKDELNLMYENLKCFGIGGFESVGYWSSSESDAYHACFQGFYSGNQYMGEKSECRRVRAVRAF